MFGPRLQAYVCVDGPDGMRQFGPDDEVPDWALPLITNPDAWEDGLPDLGDEDEGEDDPDGDGNPDETGGGESVPGDDAPAPKRPRTRAPKNADDVAGDAS